MSVCVYIYSHFILIKKIILKMIKLQNHFPIKEIKMKI